MNAALKQRLVGATVLVALAVIFLPMLLDGAGRYDDVAREVRIPDPPQAPEAALDETPEPVGAAGAEGVDDGAAAGGEAENVPAGAVEPPPQTTQASTTEGAADSGDDEPTGEAAEPVAAWAVQTGSFTRESNARAQSEGLQADGFEAFVEPAQAEGERVWRVRVGPLVDEESARTVRARLAEEHDVDGLVVRHR